MAASTVAYTDTTGNRDYLGMIASQIGRRLKEASDMASDERAYASQKAEDGGTSLEEAGIGRGYFFRRALGSRFGGDRIARTKGRMGVGGAGTNPTGNFRSRFRGGFDYNVTNELSSIPLSNALTAGLRGVESGLIGISQALNSLARGMSDLARGQEDAARQAILNGAFMQAFLNHMQREAARQRARSEERGLEQGLLGGSGGGGRNMINVTPGSGGRSGDFGDALRRGVKQALPKGAKVTTTAAKLFGPKQAAQIKKGASIAAKGVDFFGSTVVKGSKFGGTVTKGMMAMGKMGSGANAITNLLDGTSKTFKLGRTITKSLGEGGQAVRNVKKLAKAVTIGKISGPVAMLENAINPMITGDHVGSLSKMATSGGKTKKFVDTATTIAGSSKKGLDLVTTSGDVMDGLKKADAVGNGIGTAKTVAAAADAGASPGMLQRFFLGTKPKGLMRGSKLTRMLIKNPAGKMFLKKLPLIGAIAGTIFAAQRLLEGDFLGAGLELASGFMGATGAAPASLALDGFLLARDFGAVPFFNGGITSRPTLGMMSERGQKEGVFPLDGAEGKKTFRRFGAGVLEARLDNEGDDAKLQAMGHKTYYETMGGWTKFGEGILEAFGGIKDKVSDTLSEVNPFSSDNLSKVNNSSAANSIRKVIGSEIGDGYWGPKWLGIKNKGADEQANMLNNNSAQIGMGNMFVAPTIINNYNTVSSGNGDSEEVGNGAFPYSFTAFNADFSLMSKT